jgi:hypothetical protein
MGSGGISPFHLVLTGLGAKLSLNVTEGILKSGPVSFSSSAAEALEIVEAEASSDPLSRFREVMREDTYVLPAPDDLPRFIRISTAEKHLSRLSALVPADFDPVTSTLGNSLAVSCLDELERLNLSVPEDLLDDGEKAMLRQLWATAAGVATAIQPRMAEVQAGHLTPYAVLENLPPQEKLRPFLGSSPLLPEMIHHASKYSAEELEGVRTDAVFTYLLEHFESVHAALLDQLEREMETDAGSAWTQDDVLREAAKHMQADDFAHMCEALQQLHQRDPIAAHRHASEALEAADVAIKGSSTLDASAALSEAGKRTAWQSGALELFLTHVAGALRPPAMRIRPAWLREGPG